MPNWVDNELIVKDLSNSKKFKSFQDIIRDCFISNSSIAMSLYPLPDDIRSVDGWSDESAHYWEDSKGNKVEPPTMEERFGKEFSKKYMQRKLTEDELNNLKQKYGASNWYDWNILNYGTKWSDAGTEFVEVEGDRIVVVFESAWTPMWKLAQNISKDYECEVQLNHHSWENMQEGHLLFMNGDMVDDELYQIDPAELYGEDEEE
tara:strand:- start:873 stop:1487 length:615 start_codon:yes stop_codon:yes gene_type:complete